MSLPFYTDRSRCLRCGICTQVCPKALITADAEGYPVMDAKAAARCNHCGQCFAYCPVGCAVQALSAGTDMPPALTYRADRTDELLSFLKSRRSYRNYLPDAVDDLTITRILDAANYAPSGGNNRKLRWIVLKTPDKTRELSELIADWFDKTARFHPVYGKRYAIDNILARYRSGKDVILRGAPHIAFAVGPADHVWGPVDTGIALAYFNLACESFDIGCCFAGYATKSAESDAVRAFLGLKDGEKAWCAVCFGRKTLHAVRVPNRGPVPVTFL